MLTNKKQPKQNGENRQELQQTCLVKMGKDEPVSMEIFDKICIFLDCRLDDIAEMQKEGCSK